MYVNENYIMLTESGYIMCSPSGFIETKFTPVKRRYQIVLQPEQLLKFQEISQDTTVKNYVIYAGEITEERNPGMMISWIDFGDFINII